MDKWIPFGVSGIATAVLFGVCNNNIEKALSGYFLQSEIIGETKTDSALLGLLVGVSGYGLSQWIRWKLIKSLLTYRGWLFNPKSAKSKAWGMLLSTLMPKKNYLFDLQDYLPRYPLPKLADTCQKTLKVVKPFLSAKEFESFKEAMKEFQSNEGPALQKILQQRYDTEDNWLDELWNKYVYLAGRSPIPVHSNFCCLGDKNFVDYKSENYQLGQAATIIQCFMEYRDLLEAGKLRNMSIQGFIPICCERYRYVCSTTRVPGVEIDELKSYPGGKHIVVFKKGQMYKLDLFSADENGKSTLLTPREIQDQLEMIVKYSESVESSTKSPAIFTTMNRTKWANIRNEMIKDDANAKSMEVVETAVFCVAIDEDSPQNNSEEFHEYLTGNGYNRWFDKSMTLVIKKNGAHGYNVEHTTAEATISGRMWEYAYHYKKIDSDGNATHRGYGRHPIIPKPQHLDWKLEQFRSDIEEAERDWNVLAGDIDTCVYYLDKGKRFMKQNRISPDGYMQMALQLTYYRLHKHIPKTYETGATRLFKKGRTETIRPVSESSVAFVKSFYDADVKDSVKISHLKNGIKYQSNYKYQVMDGAAVDRHLLGLYLAGKFTGKLPDIFKFKCLSEPDHLSTSQSPLRYDPVLGKCAKTDPIGGGFGAQRVDGYGMSYFMCEDKVHCLISCFNSGPTISAYDFGVALQKSVDDMKHLLDSNNPAVSSNGVANGKH